MHYVKQFDINGVATKQVACIELQGAPNAATEGAVGVLGMDMTSLTHDVYRCVAVNGSVYTWELLSAGMSVISAKVSGEGAMSVTFAYSNLRSPNRYIVKPGDLILDTEGYLYQISSIGVDSCVANYCNTRIGGVANGDNDRRLVVTENGKLQLVTESGAVLSEVDYMSADGTMVYRDASTGAISIIAVKTINDKVARFFFGTKAEYDALSSEQKKNNLIPTFTDATYRGNNTGFSYAYKIGVNPDTLTQEGHYFLISCGAYLIDNYEHGFLDVDYFDGTALVTANGQEKVVKQTFRSYNYDEYIRRTGRYIVNTGKWEWTEWRNHVDRAYWGTYASYADPGTKDKGTLDERLESLNQRLTTLGFKQGTATVLGGGTATTNVLYKQGKYVYGDLEISFTGRSEGYFPTGNSTLWYSVADLPTEFRPKTGQTYKALANKTQELVTDFNLATEVTVAVNTNLSVQISGTNKNITKVYIHLGYETN